MFQIKINLVILSMMFISVSSVEYYLAYDIECGGHKCESGDCISFLQICNGIQNCEDNSDEEFCDCYTSELCYNPPTAPTVTPDQDTNELAGSSETCGEFEFTCNNGMCIDAKLKCNQKNDCGDFSDETVCTIQTESTYNSSNNQNDCGDDFRCKDGTCILFDGVCDGRMYHCADGSDEGGRCEESCLECSNPDYYRTPSGCLCTCPPNYYLAGDGVTCLDVQECEFDPPVCSQICLEERGSYSCDCFQGFILGEDGTTCLSQGDPMSIYYTVRNEIRHIVPQRRIRIVQSETGNLTSLNMDIASGLIYYSIEGNTSLHQLVVANNSRKSIANVGTVSLLALDWITQNVYFLSKQSIETNLVVNTTEEPNATPKSIEYENYSRLMMCNFAERHCANIKDLQVEVTAITIDPINKYLFYATQEYSINEDIAQNVVNLYRTELDGQDTRKIGVFDTTITDMAMDYRYKDLYIVKDIIIDRLNYNGERVLNMVETSTSIKGLNVFEDHLYFLSQGGLVMNQCQLFGETRVCSIFTLSPEDSELFFIAQSTRQTAGRNACLTYNCSHICVPNDNGAVCINENGDIVDELPQWDY